MRWLKDVGLIIVVVGLALLAIFCIMGWHP